MNGITCVEGLRSALFASMEADSRVVVLGEDILDPYGGAFKVTRGLSTAFPDRVLTTPICEGTIAGLAVGLALRGMRPVAELMFGDFVTLAADQIINHAAKFSAMYDGRVDVPLVIRTPMGGGRGYGPTHSQSLETMFLGIPHLTVVAPSLYHDPGEMLRRAVAEPGPVLFVENKLLYPLRIERDGEGRYGRTERRNASGYSTVGLTNYRDTNEPDVVLVTYGGISRFLGPLLDTLAGEEIRLSAHIVGDLKAGPDEEILQAARGAGRVVLVEEGSAEFGWGSAFAARIYDTLGGGLKAPIRRVGALPTVIPAARHLEEEVLVSRARILSALLEILQ